MDLSSMLNNDNAPEKKPSHTPTAPTNAERGNAPLASFTPPVQNGGGYPPIDHGFTRPGPLHTSVSSSGPPNHARSRDLTPLHTPSHPSGSAQYPFPPQQHPPAHSSASAHPGQHPYRSQDSYSATTPGARPSSHGYSFAHASPGAHGLGHALQHGSAHTGNSSLSPTPPSHHSQTSHAMRHSPLATMGHPPPPQQQQQHGSLHHYHHSQPSTPLGPPQLPQRHSNQQLDMIDYHHRTPSGTSNGLAAASPAQHHPGINNLVDSPSMYNHQSPHQRRTSEYRSSASRERSVSVSPKTMVPPRPPSLGSRQSSQQEVYSARNSMQPSASVASAAASHDHVQSQAQAFAPPHQAHSAIDVAQSRSQAMGQSSGAPIADASLSHSDSKTPLQHQPTKMEMSHLLTPTQHAQTYSMQNGVSYPAPSQSSNNVRHTREIPKASTPITAPPFAPPAQLKSESHIKAEPVLSPQAHHNSSMTMPTPGAQVPDAASQIERIPSRTPLKRPADAAPSVEPPAKRERRRKYTERPVWAHLSRHNPRSREHGVVPNGNSEQSRGPPAVQQRSEPIQQTNGQPNALPQDGNTSDKPWQQQPPLDNELIQARRLLGKWEKSLKWNTPLPPLTAAVADWLFMNLKNNADVGHDPRYGTIEIEAKIGTLIDVDSGQRCNLPVANPCVLQTSANRRYQFESRMNQVRTVHIVTQSIRQLIGAH